MDFLNEDEIKYIVAYLSKYYNKETIDYLKSLINLEVSVLNTNEANQEFNNEFGKVNNFTKIAVYNVINRSLKIIKDIDNVNFSKDRLYPTMQFGDLNILYNGNKDNTFSLLSTNYEDSLKDHLKISVQQIDTIKPGNKTQSLRTLSSMRRDLTNETTKRLLEDWNIEFTEQDKRLFSKDYQKSLNWVDVSKKII